MGDQRTPIKIGVTGHRYVKNIPLLEASVRDVWETITKRHRNQPMVHYNPLAPGADQLMARVVLNLPIPIIVLLPFAQDEYLKDFPAEAVEPFFKLCEQAIEIITLPTQQDSVSAYHALGKYLVEQMDYLIAIWNGQPPRGPGGSGEVVELFRQQRKPLAWVRADNALPDTLIPLINGLKQGSVVYENW